MIGQPVQLSFCDRRKNVDKTTVLAIFALLFSIGGWICQRKTVYYCSMGDFYEENSPSYNNYKHFKVVERLMWLLFMSSIILTFLVGTKIL